MFVHRADGTVEEITADKFKFNPANTVKVRRFIKRYWWSTTFATLIKHNHHQKLGSKESQFANVDFHY